MIIQVRGTSGSGKSWVMRSIKEQYQVHTPQFIPGRNRPLYYSKDRLAICGHYECISGGGDRIGGGLACYGVIKNLRESGYDSVLCEGLLLSEDTKWTHQLQQQFKDVHCLFLSTPLETCIDRINQRRVDAGNTKPLKEDNTRHRAEVIERAYQKLLRLGVKCRNCSAGQAVDTIRRLLG